jgi:transposase
MGNGNRPTPEFRREAVRLALTSGGRLRRIWALVCQR